MSLRGWPVKEFAGFRGAWTRLDSLQARPERAFRALNVRFEPGRVRSRNGYSVGFAAAGTVTGVHQWQTQSFNRVLYFDGPTSAKSYDLLTGAQTLLVTQAARGIVVAEAGNKAIIAFYDINGIPSGKVRISVADVSVATIDEAFAPPWTNVPIIADVGAGEVTQGVHKFGYIVETRTGFVGQPSPVSVFGAHAPVSFTVASGGRALTMSMTVNVPADAAFVHPIMTRTDNPDRWYFVPGAVTAVPGGSVGWPISIPIDISDERLSDSAEEANDHFDALAQTTSGTAPFGVSSVAAYGKRAVYISGNKAYFSDIDDYQFVTEAGHVVQTQGQKRIISGGSLRDSFYLIGPGWTHAVSDNGDLPATWAAPTEVSGAIGTPAPHGVEWKTAGDYAWVASPAGLFLFTGQYAPRPISYFNKPEWDRINWGAAYAVQVKDDYVNQKVYVAVPLDNAAEANAMFVFDYARGMTPEDVDFSLDTFTGVITFSGLGVIQTPDTRETQVWMARSGFVHYSDPEAHTDHGAVIASEYETGFILSGADRAKRLNRFGGIEYSVAGSGALSMTLYAPDRVRNLPLDSQTLVATPGKTFQRKLHFQEENASVRFQVTTAGAWFDLDSFRVFWKPYVTNYAAEA